MTQKTYFVDIMHLYKLGIYRAEQRKKLVYYVTCVESEKNLHDILILY